jgi:hypothetical protein
MTVRPGPFRSVTPLGVLWAGRHGPGQFFMISTHFYGFTERKVLTIDPQHHPIPAAANEGGREEQEDAERRSGAEQPAL